MINGHLNIITLISQQTNEQTNINTMYIISLQYSSDVFFYYKNATKEHIKKKENRKLYSGKKCSIRL